MVSLRAVVICLQILGVVSLALVLYVWRHPASLSRWRGADQPEHVRAQGLRPEEKTDQAVASTAATTSLAPVRVSKSQADQALWLGAKYRVAPEAVEILLVEADRLSTLHRLSPHLLIAVMAIESNFHPFIESEAGAQGLMQVMPRIHAKRYDKIGGKSIDPIVNLQVGAEILRDCVKPSRMAPKWKDCATILAAARPAMRILTRSGTSRTGSSRWQPACACPSNSHAIVM